METLIQNNNNHLHHHHHQPHVAILPCPGMGHLIPHLELAKHLCTFHGFQVTFFVYSTEASAAQSRYLDAHTFPETLHIFHLPPRNISPFVTDSTDIQTRISIIIRESLHDIESVVVNSTTTNDSPINVLVVDFFTTDAFDIAAKVGIPKYIFFCPAADLFPFMMYLPTLDRQVDGEFIDLKEPIKIPGCKRPIQIDDLVEPVRNRKIEGYKWFLHHAARFPLANGILLNTCQDLEPTIIRALGEDPILQQLGTPRVYPVGPLVKPSFEEVKSEYLTWMNEQPNDSVLFISFGSGGTLSAEQMTELAWGLELSQQRFIWVVRKPVEADASGTFFSVGNEQNNPDEYLPDGFLSRTQGRGLVIPTWAPQVEILSHSSIGGFLTHCGWNSTLESIRHGVPMIAWPLYAEQRGNAALLEEEIGVAVRVRFKRENGVVGREKIERLVRLVMEDEGNNDDDDEGKKGLRGRVKELQKLVIEAVDEGGSSYNALSEVAKEWKASVNGGINLKQVTEEITEPNSSKD
ncbi:UDP-glucuronosyl/UDP-glucosyltransferase [Macleaya cordata]|uniref:Glycosyltransferase n=1 Tax=Macleaya cordata TaxID=56857 RepID=A0A200R7G5_MACCD|nr:UDP-glucuronosyl/UDP-glucosyltransferase [Macleaya cordata]